MESEHTTEAGKQVSLVKPRRRFRWLVGPAISVAALILFIGAIELVAYIWEQKTAQGPLGWTLVASRRMAVEVHGSEDQPYFLLEPGQDYNWEGVPVHISSRGLRNDEFEVPKPQDTYRILNLGDSVAFGWEVDQEETYGYQLVDLLNQQDKSQNYEVINAGVPGWSLETERNFLLQEGLSYQPDLVLLDLTIVNDILAGAAEDSDDKSQLLNWLRDNTYLWPFLTIQMRFLLARQRGPEAIPVLSPGSNPDFYFPLDADDEIWDQHWQDIEDMYLAATEMGAEFKIVAFPTALQVNSASHPDIPQQVFSERAQEMGIEFIDMLPFYKEECDKAAADACEGFENMLFADVWMHPTTLGHTIAAQEIANTIVDN